MPITFPLSWFGRSRAPTACCKAISPAPESIVQQVYQRDAEQTVSLVTFKVGRHGLYPRLDGMTCQLKTRNAISVQVRPVMGIKSKLVPACRTGRIRAARRTSASCRAGLRGSTELQTPPGTTMRGHIGKADCEHDTPLGTDRELGLHRPATLHSSAGCWAEKSLSSESRSRLKRLVGSSKKLSQNQK